MSAKAAASRPTASAAADAPAALEQRFADAYLGYQRALQDAGVEAERRLGRGHRDYLASLEKIQLEAAKREQEAYARYGQTLEKTARSEAPAQDAANALGEFLQEVQRSRETAAGELQAAAQSWGATQQECGAALQERRAECFRRFLETTREAWASAPPAELDARSLAAIGQTLMAAACAS